VIYSYYLEVGKDLSVNFVDKIQVPNLVMLPELGCVIYIFYTVELRIFVTRTRPGFMDSLMRTGGRVAHLGCSLVF